MSGVRGRDGVYHGQVLGVLGFSGTWRAPEIKVNQCRKDAEEQGSRLDIGNKRTAAFVTHD